MAAPSVTTLALASDAAYSTDTADAQLKAQGWTSLATCRKARAYERGNHVILAFRGTVDAEDALCDAALALGNEGLMPRFIQALSVVRALARRMGSSRIILTGHSLGGSLALYCAFKVAAVSAGVFNAFVSSAMVAKFGFNCGYTRCTLYKVTQDALATTGSLLAARGATVISQSQDTGKGNAHTILQFLPLVTRYVSTAYLVVGGGGGAGGNGGGGGGAGGLLQGTFNLAIGTGTYTATVGAGGLGHADTASGGSGSNSALIGTNISATALGGGGSGARGSNLPTGGGSGGGGGGAATGQSLTIYGAGTVGQGYNGAPGSGILGSDLGGNATGGGGGGASATGTAGSNAVSGNGGNGVASSITGTSVYYGGGGAGGTVAIGSAGTAGLGGGGSGGRSGAQVGGNGTNGLGGGAGGGGPSSSGGTGGSGVVIVSFPTSSTYSPTTTGTVTASGSNTIVSFTSSGTLGLTWV